jgi:hypothetical protein
MAESKDNKQYKYRQEIQQVSPHSFPHFQLNQDMSSAMFLDEMLFLLGGRWGERELPSW